MSEDKVKKAEKTEKAVESAEKQIISERASTDTKIWIEVIGAIIFTTIVALIAMSLKGLGGQFRYVNGLINERGPIQYAELFCFWMAIFLVIQKSFLIRKQLKYIYADSAKTREMDMNNEEEMKTVSHRLAEMKLDRKSILWGRLARAIALWLGSHDLGRVTTFVSSESAREAGNSDNSFTIARTLLWAIPILGFIGTVQGLAAAVSGFADFLSGSAELSAIKGAIADVTIGLGVAFDTTFLALILVTIVQFPLSSVMKKETMLLGDIDVYTDEYFLSVLPSAEQQPVVIENLEDSIEAAFRRYIPDPGKYEKVFDSAMDRAGGLLEKRMNGIAEKFADVQAATNRDLSNALDEAHERAAKLGEKYAHSSDAILSTLQDCLQSASRAAEGIGSQTAAVASLGGKIQEMLAAEKALDRALASVAAGQDFQGLIASLRDHLKETDDFCKRMSKPRVITFREDVVEG